MINSRRILLVDDHRLFRKAISKLILGFETSITLFEASNGLEGMRLLALERIDIILLDVQMPEMGGIEMLKKLRQLAKETKIIMLTQFDDESLIIFLLQLGANGYLRKDCDPSELELAIKEVSDTGHYYNSAVLEAVKHNLSHETKLSNLNISAREFQVMVLLKEGKSNKEIAICLGLTQRTIESYRKGLIKKTNCRNTVDLISLAYRTGILPDVRK